MTRLIRYLLVALVASALAGCATSNTTGAMPDQAQTDLAFKASAVLRRQMAAPPDKRVPKAFVNNAQCIAVFPQVVEAGFIVGGRRGKGLISCRQESGGWQDAAPAVFTLTGASVGLQAGAKKSSVILLFMTPDSVNALLGGKIKLGAGLAVTAGTLGFNADVSHAPSPVLAYVASKEGLFAGVNLSGSRISFSDSANAKLYGNAEDAHDILLGTAVAPGNMDAFVQQLQRYTSSASH